MDVATYERLGLAIKAADKLNENPNGNSWENDTSHDAPYALGPESLARADGVVAGAIIPHLDYESTTFPDSKRDWWVYVPAQYTGEEEMNLIVFQDGSAYLKETPAGVQKVRVGCPTPTYYAIMRHASEIEQLRCKKVNMRGV